MNDKKGCTRLAATSANVYQLLSHGRWFSPGTPASSTTKTGRHDIAEILLKVALNTISQIKSNHMYPERDFDIFNLYIQVFALLWLTDVFVISIKIKIFFIVFYS